MFLLHWFFGQIFCFFSYLGQSHKFVFSFFCWHLGQAGFKHTTDTGWYGKGVYFSEYPEYSMDYIQGAEKLLLCQVLPGKVFHCKKLIHGAALSKGHDSHTSPDKKELVIFNSHHILPCYVVHYKFSSGEFKYAVKLIDWLIDKCCISSILAI